jgi:hypothetical protein
MIENAPICFKLVTQLDLDGDLIGSSREAITSSFEQELSNLGDYQTIECSGKIIKFAICETETGWIQTSLVANF